MDFFVADRLSGYGQGAAPSRPSSSDSLMAILLYLESQLLIITTKGNSRTLNIDKRDIL